VWRFFSLAIFSVRVRRRRISGRRLGADIGELLTQDLKLVCGMRIVSRKTILRLVIQQWVPDQSTAFGNGFDHRRSVSGSKLRHKTALEGTAADTRRRNRP
jgi:hypothetical protein